MQSYGMTFGFREPYQVLGKLLKFSKQATRGNRDGYVVDAQMIQDTARFKMDLLGGLERVLQGKIKPMITQCSIRHLYTLPVPQPDKDPLILLAKSMERRRCNHHDLDEPLSSLECLSSVIDPKKSATNRNRYVVASQGDEVRRFCRGVKGVPLVYVKRSVMILEPMADSTVGVREGLEREKFRTGLRAKPGKRKRVQDDEQAADEVENEKPDGNDGEDKENGEKPAKKRKARGPKGPNPLSVKKTKKDKPRTVKDDGLALAEGEPGDRSEVETTVIERPKDGAEAPLGKRKRKRKHKSGGLNELNHTTAESEEADV
ncbi:MAG: hypothetical protein Q9182_007456 [Xanthomendoza sp. 2 TL-2023]